MNIHRETAELVVAFRDRVDIAEEILLRTYGTALSDAKHLLKKALELAVTPENFSRERKRKFYADIKAFLETQKTLGSQTSLNTGHIEREERTSLAGANPAEPTPSSTTPQAEVGEEKS